MMIQFKEADVEQFFRTKVISNFDVNQSETRIVFSTNLDGSPNVWALDLEHRFPYPITMIDQQASFLRIDPDGRFILAGFDDDGNENFQIYALPSQGGQPTDLITGKPDQKFYFGELTKDGRYIYYTSSKDSPMFLGVYRYSLEEGTHEKLLEGNEVPHFFAGASPKYQTFAFMKHYANTYVPCFVFDEGKPHSVVPDPTRPHVVNSVEYIDETTVYFTTDYDADFTYLAKYDIDQDEFHVVQKIEGAGIRSVYHDKQNHQLYLIVEQGVEDVLYTYDLTTNELKKDELPVSTVFQFKVMDSGGIYLLGTTARVPHNIYRRMNGQGWERITENRVLGFAEADMVEPEVLSYQSFDGMEIEALLFEAKPRHSNGWTIVWPHGGPQASESKFFRSIFQLFCYAGYNVFAPNFRGSTRYGSAFTKLVEGDWGEGPRKDVMEGVRHLVDTGRAESEKLVVVGGSFGGYMTLLLHGRHADEFHAFVDIFGPSNLFTFYDSVPDHWKPIMKLWLGDPDEDHDRFVSDSPITYLDNMTKPMMVIQGANDPRVVKEESDQIVAALRDKDVPVEYIVLEDEGHGFSKKKNEIHVYREILRFLDEHCG